MSRIFRYLLLTIYLLLIHSWRLEAQDALSIKLGSVAIQHAHKGMVIGDRMPDTALLRIFNYTSTEHISWNDLKGKLVILDFWHQYCSSCVAMLPKLAKLQKQFPDRLLILPVTFQSKNSVKKFFTKSDKGEKPICLPSIVEDTILRRYFPHDGDPYEVWIDGNGIVRSFTNDSSVNECMIKDALSNNYKKLTNISIDPSFDVKKKFLVGGNGGDAGAFIYRSMLTGQNHKLRSFWYFYKDSSYIRIFVSNFSAISILKRVFFELHKGDTYEGLKNDPLDKRVLIEPDFKNNLSKLYCYDLMIPSNFSYEEAFRIMFEQLKQVFRLDLSISHRKTTGLALIKVGSSNFNNKKQLAYAGNSFFSTSEVTNYLNIRSTFPFIFDDVNDSTNIGVKKLSIYLNSLDRTNQMLENYGLKLVPTERNIYIMNIRPKIKVKNEDKDSIRSHPHSVEP